MLAMKDKILKFFSGDRPAAERLGTEPVKQLLLLCAENSPKAETRAANTNKTAAPFL